MNQIFSKGVGKFLLVLLGLAIAGYFAWNFYFFGEWMGLRFLTTVPYGQYIAGYTAGAIMLIAVLVSFFYKEHFREAIEAFESKSGDGSFIRAFGWLIWAVVGLEVFSVGFRCFALDWSGIGWVLLGVGLGLLGLEYIVGKIIHAVANAPSEYKAARVMDAAESMVWDKAPELLGRMSVGQLREVSAGNTDPLDHMLSYQDSQKAGKESAYQIRQKKQQTKLDRAREMASNWIAPKHNETTEEDF